MNDRTTERQNDRMTERRSDYYNPLTHVHWGLWCTETISPIPISADSSYTH